MEKHTKKTKQTSSYLFTIRIWCESLGEDRKEWRGQVEHLLSGKSAYFRDWPALLSFLHDTLEVLEPDAPSFEREKDSNL